MRVSGRAQARFESKVEPQADGCWLWRGTILTASGYGQFWLDGRAVQATHVALAIEGRGVPRGMLACHSCDVPACVNPAHIFVSTPLGNQQDMHAKGRANPPRGERQTLSILTEAKVREIRARLAVGATQRTLAREYGVHPSTISLAARGRTWECVS